MKYTSLFFTLLLLVLFMTWNTPTAYAAKARVSAPAKTSTAKAVKGVSYSSVRLSRPSNSVVVSFTNLSNVSKVTYMLSYSTNGLEQGAVGSVTPSGATDQRDLYVGTCSKGVCTPHYNIKNMSLTITTKLKSGATYSKRYRIKW